MRFVSALSLLEVELEALERLLLLLLLRLLLWLLLELELELALLLLLELELRLLLLLLLELELRLLLELELRLLLEESASRLLGEGFSCRLRGASFRGCWAAAMLLEGPECGTRGTSPLVVSDRTRVTVVVTVTFLRGGAGAMLAASGGCSLGSVVVVPRAAAAGIAGSGAC